ncbi:MAG: L-2-amino-thiazoline-4-carboxylic acid hydrolase [Gammaproteobacteria bacterium]|nr:L-2-amino-thiazoline-4-carboxylic acid hydrolase [Gammaproteobacteria bacterium]
MTRTENEQRIRDQFGDSRERAINLASRFVDDAEVVVDQAAEIFDSMIPDMAYVDNPDSPMASSVFICCGSLALFLALKPRGVDAHQYGGALLDSMRSTPPTAPETTDDGTSPQERFSRFIASGEASQSTASPGEFVFEALVGDRSEYDWGMNIKSCAICHAFSKYDAMDLVPYMCATDDLMSDIGAQGLRRTGTIALGAHQCDFRYKSGGEPLRLVGQYPDRIRDPGQE